MGQKWIQNMMMGMGGHNIWNGNWCNGWVGVGSVGQAVGVRSDKRCRQITCGIDTAACRTAVPARHPATRGYRCHWDAEAGVSCSTAGKSVGWVEGRRFFVSKDTEGKPMTIESRPAKVRRLVMAVKPKTPQGQWVCVGHIDTGSVIPYESTPNGWNFTVELEAPNTPAASCKKSRTS